MKALSPKKLWTALRGILRLNSSPHGIAMGFSMGLVLSAIPIPFFGMFAALALCSPLRANPIAAYTGTAVVNPFTAPLIYFFELYLGSKIWGITLPAMAEITRWSPEQWLHSLERYGLPFLTGIAIVMSICALSYPLIFVLAARYQRAHQLPPESSTLATETPASNDPSTTDAPV